MSKFDLVIFDNDGVLVDSETIIKKLRQAGADIIIDDMRHLLPILNGEK